GPGGQFMTATDVDNWPADGKGVQGTELMERSQKHAQRFETEVVFDHIHTVRLQERPLRLQGDAGEYTCDALIVATGASARYLGLESEKKFMGKGVSACATCDGFFYKGQDVAVVGGGNTAVEEALYPSNITRRVTVIHRRDKVRAEKILQKKLFDRSNVTMRWNHVLDEVLGDAKGVAGARIKDTQTGATQQLAVQGLFIAVGHTPNTGIFEGQLEMKGGYIVTRGGSEGNASATSVPGVFAAGDVQDHVYRQAVTSAGSGCIAALDAEKYLDGLGRNVLHKLRRGHWVVQDAVDLHGSNRDEARSLLAEFLSDCLKRGLRCVRVIHGKGLRSPKREPVLKGKVRQWLAQRDEVLAFCQAPTNQGGSGALLGLLRA